MPVKTSLAFGLVYIPVTLTPAVKNNDIGFNMLHKETHERIRYVKTAPSVGEVKNEDIVKGYEYEKGRYVIFEDKDFEKLKTEKDKNIEIQKFVHSSEIDPVFYEKAYYVSPSGGEKAFALLVNAMEDTGMTGIAKTVMGTKETVIAVFAENKKMRLITLHFADEITASPASAVSGADEKELKLAESLIENMTGTFDPEEYRDEYRVRLTAAIEDKIAGKEITAPSAPGTARAVDLMEALVKSVEATGTKKKPGAYKRERKRA